MSIFKWVKFWKTKRKTSFSYRIAFLSDLFGRARLAKLVGGADEQLIKEWEDSNIADKPLGVDFAPLLFQYSLFNPTWLNEGKGNVFVDGNFEENREAIIQKEAERFKNENA